MAHFIKQSPRFHFYFLLSKSCIFEFRLLLIYYYIILQQPAPIGAGLKILTELSLSSTWEHMHPCAHSSHPRGQTRTTLSPTRPQAQIMAAKVHQRDNFAYDTYASTCESHGFKFAKCSLAFTWRRTQTPRAHKCTWRPRHLVCVRLLYALGVVVSLVLGEFVSQQEQRWRR